MAIETLRQFGKYFISIKSASEQLPDLQCEFRIRNKVTIDHNIP
jgi:hypothetical protein